MTEQELRYFIGNLSSEDSVKLLKILLEDVSENDALDTIETWVNSDSTILTEIYERLEIKYE